VSDKTTWMVALIVSTVLGSLAGYLVTSRTLTAPLERLTLVTPVFVLDKAAVIQSLPPEASPETIERAMSAWRAKAERLAASGYLILDASLVVAAPEDVYVRDER
jgi:hypothetical protein